MNLRVLLAALFLAVTPLAAQTPDTGTVTIPRSALTPRQLATVEAQSVKQKAEAYGAWVGVGKEVGEAVNSSLAAISDNAAKFADTKVGKVAMFIVVWKVVGNDALGILYGVIVVLIGVPVLVWSYRRHLNPTVLDKEKVDDKGKVVERIYRNLSYDERGSRDAILIFHAIGALILLISSAFAIFG